MRGSLHCATDGKAVRCFGRDDAVLGEEVEGIRSGADALGARARDYGGGLLSAFGGGGVDDGFDGGDGVGGEACVCGVFADEVFAGCDVDADDLVRGDVGVDPLDLGTEVSEDRAGVLGGGYELVRGEVADVGHVAFDEVLWHGGSFLGGVRLGFICR
jgi:hypothetical protein